MTPDTPETTSPLSPACGCGTGDPDRHAVGVDPEIKRRVTSRLRRIEGQVRGLQRMVEEERYCADVMTQVSSVQEALSAVSRELLRNHLRYCVTDALRSGDDAAAEQVCEEVVALVARAGRSSVRS